jgi:glycosyltransferase involved in cell wall biosynthesis
MKVLISLLKFPPDFTGAGYCTEWLYRKLKAKGVTRVYVITTSAGAPVGVDRREGIVVIRVARNRYIENQKSTGGKIGKAFFTLTAGVRAMAVYFRLRREVDLVHTVDSSWLSTAIAWCAAWTKKPLVREIVLLGHDDPLTLAKKWPVIRSIFLKPFHDAKLIITVSPPLKDACVAYGLPESKIWCRPNTIYFESKTADEPLGVDIRKPAILWVGKVAPRKNVDFLLRAAAYLEGPVQVLIAGPCDDPVYLAQLKEAADGLAAGTQVRVHFLGNVENRVRLRRLYESASLFWFASHKEGLGNVVIESLLAGTPVVTLPVDGIMRHVLDGPGDGEIVDTQDEREFARVVNRCLKDYPFDRADIAARARRRFDPGALEDEYIVRYKALIA